MISKRQKWLVIVMAFFAAVSLVQAADESPVPATPKKKNKYQRSKLTRDETEATADRRTILLSTGEDRTVDLDFVPHPMKEQAYAVGNPTVLGYTPVGMPDGRKQVVLKPLKAGVTSFTVRDGDGVIKLILNVKITGTNLLRTAGEVRELLKDIEGIEIRIVGQKIIIDGEVIVPMDYGRIVSVLQEKSYSDVVLNLANISPLAMQFLAKKIQEDVSAFAPNVKTRVVNGLIFLEGSVDKPDDALRAEKLASLYIPEARPGNSLATKDPSAQVLPGRKLIYNFIVWSPPPPKKQEKLVRLTVHFVELSKNYNRLFGFKWQPGFTADPQISVGNNSNGQAAASGATFSATISNLIPKLQTLQNAGYARILKTGTLIVRSGQKGVLNEQTEYPYTMIGANGVPQAASKGVGLKVETIPTILGQSDDISLNLDLSQTNVVGRTPANGPPVTAAHNITTNIYVKSSESAAVAGLSASTVGTEFNLDDPSGNGGFGAGTEALFTLQRSKNTHKQKSQFVIFVTPQVVENASEGTEDMKRNFRVKVR